MMLTPHGEEILQTMAKDNAKYFLDQYLDEHGDTHDLDAMEIHDKTFDQTLSEADRLYEWMEEVTAVEVSDICWEAAHDAVQAERAREIFGED